MSDECEDRKYDREYLDNSDVVIEKLKKQARRYRVVESRYNAKESIIGNPCLDIEWHTAPLPKQCYCPVEPCICTSHLLKQGNLPESIPVDTYRKATKEPDGTLIPRLAAAVEAEVEISSQLDQCGQLKDRGPEFCASHCPAFLTPVKESGFYAQKRKLIEKYIKDNKLEKKMQRLLNLKTNDLMRTKYSPKGSQREVAELPEINIPKTVVTSRPVARRKKLTEKEEVEELEQILGIESHKDEPETLLRSSKSSLHPDKDSLSSTKGRPCGGLTSALTSKRDSEHSRGPSCDSEAIQPTESELNRAYNKIRSFKLKHLCEEDPMPKFSPTKRMVELKPRPKSNRIEDCVATSEEIAAKKKACEDDSKGPFKPEAKQVTSLYECKPRPISESELLSEPKKVLSGEPKRISEPELRRIFEPRRMSLDDPKLSNQLRKMPDLKRKPENESGITDDAANTYDPKTKPLIEINKSVDDPKTTITSGHVLGQISFPKRIADDDEHRPTSQHVRTLDLEPKQTNEDANDSKFEETNKRESKRTEDRKPVNENESKRTFGYRRNKKESKQVCEPKPSLKIMNGGASETAPRICEFRKLFESKRKSNSKTKQMSSDERKCDLEVKKPPGDESKLQPESKKKPVEEPKRQKEQRRTAREASKYTSRGDLKQISDARRTLELGSRQTSELRQPCEASATIILSSAHPSRASMPSPASAGSGHSKHSTKSDKSLCDDKKDKGLGKRSDSARTASGASSRDASAKETDKPCPCFEDESDSTKTRGRRPGKDENCLCKAKECLSKFGANPSDDKGPIGRTYHSVI